MTIATMEELEAVPVGTGIAIGGSAQARRTNTWQRTEEGFERNGLTLPPAAFGTDLSNGAIRRQDGQVEVEAGRVYHERGSRWSFLVLDRTGPEDRSEESGWWMARFTTEGIFESLEVRSEVPGPATTPPAWYVTAWSLGTALLLAMRRSRGSVVVANAATERLREMERSATTQAAVGQQAVIQAVDEVRRAAEEDRDVLSDALLAYCEEHHIKPDDPLVQIMRDHGLRTPTTTVPVTVTMSGTVRTVVSQAELASKLPAGSAPMGGVDQNVLVYFTKDVVVNVTTDEPGCVCDQVGWQEAREALLAEVIETYNSTMVRRACPRH